jgi:hypothetical protein
MMTVAHTQMRGLRFTSRSRLILGSSVRAVNRQAVDAMVLLTAPRPQPCPAVRLAESADP